VAKLGWSILTKPNSAEASILINKYGRRANWLKVIVVSNGSSVWRGIVKCADILC